jgi:hypothetical protein
MHELSEGDDILAGDGGLDFFLAPLHLAPLRLAPLRLAPLCLAPRCLLPRCLLPRCLLPRCLQVLQKGTRAHAHGARSACDVAIVAVLGLGALLIATECH